MNNLLFLEHLAKHAFHHQSVTEIFTTQPIPIQLAFIKNKPEDIKQLISTIDYYANEDDVVQITVS